MFKDAAVHKFNYLKSVLVHMNINDSRICEHKQNQVVLDI